MLQRDVVIVEACAIGHALGSTGTLIERAG
jgi:hypothetical protein